MYPSSGQNTLSRLVSLTRGPASRSAGAGGRAGGADVPGSSRVTVSGALPVRRPRNAGCRTPPSRVHSLKRTSAQSRGSTQWCPLPAGVPTSKGEVGRSSGASARATVSSVAASKPVPTLPT